MKNLLINRALAAKKKKIFTLLLAVATSVGTMFAQKIKIGDLYYNLDATNQTAEVTSFSDKYSGAIVIPSSVTYNSKTFSLTSIGNNAFEGCTGLTSIEIPNSVTSIGKSAFQNCTGLTSVTIPNSVTSIGWYAFYGCSSLTSVTIPNSVTSIEDCTFWGCSSLTSVTIPNSVTSIGASAFWGCSSLTSVTIPNSVTSIGGSAFYNCSGLTSIEIPNSVTRIGEMVFSGCGSLTSVTIPNSVTSIGEHAFRGCRSLTSVTIPNSVTSIGRGAFQNCHRLTSITIPINVDTIAPDCLNSCDSLTTIFWNARKASWMNEANYLSFSGCPKLSALVVGETVDSLPSFLLVESIHKVVWNPSHYAYSARLPKNTNRISFGNKVTYIPPELCEDTKIDSLVIPNSVKTIGAGAFNRCVYLTSVVIGSGVTTFDYVDNWLDNYGVFTGSDRISSFICYAPNPPSIHYNPSFNVAYVPSNSVNAYKAAKYWKNITILPIGATSVETDDIHITPSDNYANIVWQAIANAATYELYIEIAGIRIVWTFVFDAQGLLTSMVSHAPARYHSPQQTQTTGFSYVVMGLDGGTTYNATIIAKDKNGNTLNSTTSSFTTTGEPTQAIDDIEANNVHEVKVLRNGKMYIIRGEKTYTMQGQEVK